MSAQVVHLPLVADLPRPRVRGDCIDGPRPCPWVSCTEHAIHGALMTRSVGAEIDDDAALALLESMPSTCTLDVADAGGGTLEEISDLWGVTRERIRQLEGKALRALPRRTEHLHDALDEEPERVFRTQGGGPVRPVEEVRRHEPTAQHAHLPGPDAVNDAAQPFWCPWIGTALSGGLCVKRHQARTGASSRGGGAAGHSWPTYPQCSRCTDGAAMAARLGAVAELVPLRVVVPTEAASQEHTAAEIADVVAVPVRAIDWMGEGPEEASAPANDTEHTEHTEHTEEKVMPKVMRSSNTERVQAMNAARITRPAPGARCAFPGCEHPPIPWMAELAEEFRGFCKNHRTRAQVLRTTLQVDAAAAAARLIAGAGKGTTRARTAKPEPEAVSDTPRCGIKGCSEERAGVRADTRSELAPFCAEHRDSVRNAHARAGGDWGLAVRRVAALVAAGVDTTNRHKVRAVYEREGLLLGGAPLTEAASVVASPVQSPRDESFTESWARTEIERVRAQFAASEQQRDDLRRDRDYLAQRLAAEAERVEQLEGQRLADATARPSPPLLWARIDTLVRSLNEAAEGARFEIYRTDADQWRAEAVVGTPGAARCLCGSEGADPDAAAANLLAAAEFVVIARIAELNAALEGARG